MKTKSKAVLQTCLRCKDGDEDKVLTCSGFIYGCQEDDVRGKCLLHSSRIQDIRPLMGLVDVWCSECRNDSMDAVRRCTSSSCPLWPYKSLPKWQTAGVWSLKEASRKIREASANWCIRGLDVPFGKWGVPLMLVRRA